MSSNNSSYIYASGKKGQDTSEILVIKDKIVLSKNITEQRSSSDSPILLKNPFYGVIGDGTATSEYLSLNQYIHKFSGDSAWVLYNNYLKTLENDLNVFIGNNTSIANKALDDTNIFTADESDFRDTTLVNLDSNYIEKGKCNIVNKPFKLFINADNSHGIYSMVQVYLMIYKFWGQ